jgi:hypothetical protein
MKSMPPRLRFLRPGDCSLAKSRLSPVVFLGLIAALPWGGSVLGADATQVPDFHSQIEPILTEYCYECHGLGEKKGNVAFDELKTDDQLLQNPDLWAKALRNVRSNLMPPVGKPRPSAEERALLASWIKYRGIGIDPADPDPGRVTIRRLNRTEYHNTIRDLMGYDFRAGEEFPPDDTGYGFDNIGDVLSISPLLMEKYLKAAEAIVTAAVPLEGKTIAERTIPGTDFVDDDGKPGGSRMTYYKPAHQSHTLKVRHDGSYRLGIDLTVFGQFDFDPGECQVSFKIDDGELLNNKFRWNDNKKFHYDYPLKLTAGEHKLSFDMEPQTDPKNRINSLDMQLVDIRLEGPYEDEFRVRTKGYDRFFTKDAPPTASDERREYAREILKQFAQKAYRRPVDAGIVDRLSAIAEGVYSHEGSKFEEGIQRAMTAVLASPRFLFRIEEADPKATSDGHPLVDEFSLASRLSYFLWSSMPDDELIGLAQRGELRQNLDAQIKRMLKDDRSRALVQNFVGQWLQVRDVEGISINDQAVLAREDDELRKLLDGIQKAKTDFDRRVFFRQLRFRPKAAELNGDIRKAMQQEAEMLFGYILREDRSLLDLIDCDYTFVNDKLAKHYGLPAVTGSEMRRVELPKDSPRGGVLTLGSVLVVTSNPDRTSPVKRGLFILDNILGSSPPPPPGDVPPLEESEKEFQDHEPTVREILEVHRSKALCSSCHSRMDPLGLGFENFNAMGMWREKERGQPIDAKGQLITGESFESVRQLKEILKGPYHADFYRCLTEKLLTYALGRGLTNNDIDSVDNIVDRLEQNEGRFSALLTGIIQSPEFQKRRKLAQPVSAE